MDTASRLIDRLDGFVNETSSLGVSGVDPTEDAYVDVPKQLPDAAMLSLWRDNHYAAIGVDEIPENATRKGWAVTTPDDMPDGLDKANLACDFDDDWSIFLMVREAMSYGDLFGLGAIIPVLDDGLHPSEPLDLSRPYRLLNLVVADKRELTPVKWAGSMTKRGFGRPEIWSYSPLGNGAEVAGLYIHDSRIIKFGGRPVPRDVLALNNGANDSKLRKAYTPIQHKTTIDQSRAVLMNDFKVDVITSPDLDSLTTADEQFDYQERRLKILAKAKSLLNLVLLDGKETYTKTTTSVAGVADLDDRATNEVASALRMPQTRLNGEAPGGLNTDGESQTKNFNDQVAATQRLFIKPGLVKLYRIVFGATDGPTKGVVPERFYIEFASLDEPTEQQKANTRLTVAQTDAVYLDRGVIAPDRVERSRFGDSTWSVDLQPDDEAIDAQLFDVPPVDAAAPVDQAAQPDAAASSLNGAQVKTMLEVVAAATAGQIPFDSARSIIAAAYGYDDARAARIVAEGSAVRNPVAVATLPDPNAPADDVTPPDA